MDLEYGFSSSYVGAVEHYTTVEPTGPQQGGVQDVWPVGRCDDDDVGIRVEPVHLDQYLVQGLLALVVAAAQPCSAVTPYGIDLVHKDNARRVTLGLVEQISNTRRADTYKHLDEFRAADTKERHAGFTGHGLCQQRLAGSRRPDEQHALGNARAQRDKFLGLFEELDDLLQFFLGLVNACHVAKGHSRLVSGEHTGTALAKGKCLVICSLGLP